MTTNLTTAMVRDRPNPRGYAIEGTPPIYNGSPLATATAMPQLTAKADSLLKLIQDNGSSTMQKQLVRDHFSGFEKCEYLDGVKGTSVQVIKANEHFISWVMTLELSANDYYSLNSANLVLYLQAVSSGTTAITKTTTTSVEAFWGCFITSVKIKRPGDVNVLNINRNT